MTAPSGPIDRIERLTDASERRLALLSRMERAAGLDPEVAASPATPRGPRERAHELREHTRSFLLPRARDLEAPLLVVITGPTGSGKSSLMNALVGAPVSRAGVLRPTTRHAIAVGSDKDLAVLRDGGALASIPEDLLERHDSDAFRGLVIVDTPDVDSAEHANRALADHLLEAADFCVFVTTATRYADQVAWDVLRRAEERGLPLVVVVNRMPSSDASTIVADVTRLLGSTGLEVVDMLTIVEGAIAGEGTALDPAAVRPLLVRLGHLSSDREARKALAERALAGAFQGISPLASAVADDLDRDASRTDSLRAQVRAAYAAEAELMFERLFSGSVLREEVIRHWHSFVGADQVTRLFAGGIGRLRSTLAAVLQRPPRAPIAVVKQGAADDIVALVASHAADASRRGAERWTEDGYGALLMAEHPGLWSSSHELEPSTREAVEAWVVSIASDVATRGASRHGTARVAAFSVNALAVTLMLLTFAHTGGVTGVEAGIAAAAALLNQKLLNAIFGEAAVQEMIRRARQGLRDALAGVLDEERRRFDDLIVEGEALRALATELRAIAT